MALKERLGITGFPTLLLMKDGFEKIEHLLNNPYIVVNPYLINTLCAMVMFKSPEAIVPTITVRGKRCRREDLSHSFPASTIHFLPVLGLYANHLNLVDISLPDGSVHQITIKTDELPHGFAPCLSVRTSADYLKDNFMFLAPSGRNLPAAYDYKGDIRWLLSEYTLFDIKRAADGNLLTGSSRFCHMPYNATGLIELNMLAKIHKEYRLPGNYHHDHFEMEDGNLLVLMQDFHRDTVEDMCVPIDRDTAEILKVWDYKKMLPQEAAGSGSQDAHDWFHNNSIWYDKATHSITVSGRLQDAIVNFNFDSGELNWIIGDPEGWPKEMVDQYFFKPMGDVENFDWQYEQHAALIRPNGEVEGKETVKRQSKTGQRKTKVNMTSVPPKKTAVREALRPTRSIHSATGKAVAELRAKFGMSHSEFAKLLGIGAPTISNWEKKTGALGMQARSLNAWNAARGLTRRQAKKN